MSEDQTEALRNAIVKVVALAYLDGITSAGGTAGSPEIMRTQMLATLKDDTFRQMDDLMELIGQFVDRIEKKLVN